MSSWCGQDDSSPNAGSQAKAKFAEVVVGNAALSALAVGDAYIHYDAGDVAAVNAHLLAYSAMAW